MEEWREGWEGSIFYPCHPITLHPSISHPPAAPRPSMIGSGALFRGTKSQGCKKETQGLGNSLIVLVRSSSSCVTCQGMKQAPTANTPPVLTPVCTPCLYLLISIGATPGYSWLYSGLSPEGEAQARSAVCQTSQCSYTPLLSPTPTSLALFLFHLSDWAGSKRDKLWLYISATATKE